MSHDVMIDEFDFSTSQGAEVAKESNKGGEFQREVMFLQLKADPASVQQGKDRAIVRLATEYEMKPWMSQTLQATGGKPTKYSFAWITVGQHYARTKQRPPYAREGSQWPEKRFAVCRKDRVFRAKYNDQCLLCEQQVKASDRTFALGIEREQVFENGQLIGIRDKMREVLEFDEKNEPIVLSQDGDKKTYKKKWVPAWVVLNFGWKNFYNALNGQAQYFKSVLGRDFFITRTGTGNNDTNYSFVTLDTIQMGGDWAKAAGVQDGTVYDLGMIVGEDNGRPIPMVERLYPDMPDLRRIIASQTSDDYYGRWFVPGWLPEGFDPSTAPQQQGGPPQSFQGAFQPSGGVGQSGPQQGYAPPSQPSQPAQPSQPVQPQPPTNEGQNQPPNEAALDALRARVTGGAPQQQGQQEQQPNQQQPPQEQAQQQPSNQEQPNQQAQQQSQPPAQPVGQSQ